MRIALAGNPNSGKTTLFNALTKLNQKTGNWGGVTVGLKQGKLFNDKSVEIVDLPGVYSLYPFTNEEVVTMDYLQGGQYDVIINIVDSTNLERNLNLTLQLLELNLPVVVALNMQDELKRNGMTLDVDSLKRELNVDAVQISALKGKNIDTLIQQARLTAQSNKQKPTATVAELAPQTQAQKSTQRQQYIQSKLPLFLSRTQSKQRQTTDSIDKVLTNKWLAFPIFAFVIWLMYYVSVQIVGEHSITALEWLFNDVIGAGIAQGLENAGTPEWVGSLVVDGIIAGVGTVLSFIPQIVALFIFITILESTGYMARVAFIMDRVFNKLGLSGKSFIPMIIGCGCSVPAILSAKTIEGHTERRHTIMLTPFVPCSAKLPVFALFAGIFFRENSFAAPSMYFLGIAAVIVGGLILKKLSGKKGASDTFIIEMPHYRLPNIKGMLIEVWDKAREFFIRAGTVIFIASIVVWFMQSFNFLLQPVQPAQSMLALLGKLVAPLLAPLGFGNWQASVAFLSGMFAKETVAGTFAVLFSDQPDLAIAMAQLFTPQAAYAFMTFVLLSSPCIAALSATRKELGSTKLMWKTIGFQMLMAYAAALLANQLGNLWIANKAIFVAVIVNVVIAFVLYKCIRSLVTKRNNKCIGCSGCSNNKDCNR